MRIKAGGAEVQVRATDVSPANPAGLTAPDNCMLIHLSEATLLENVRARYFAKEIYTLTGSILLAMNPFETLPIYSEAKMEPYKGKPLGKAPAHVYGTAESAYQMLSRTKQPQSIVVSGESGAGKTETNKHLMYYLAWRSKSGSRIETLAEAILQSNPVLEAFGNAKTARNNNSSRFGKFVKILIDPKGNIVGARMNQYLLEKSRVVTLGEGERNYHAFYHLVAGGSPDAEALGLGKGVRSFFYLNQSSVDTVGPNPDPNPNPKPGLNPKPYAQLSPQPSLGGHRRRAARRAHVRRARRRPRHVWRARGAAGGGVVPAGGGAPCGQRALHGRGRGGHRRPGGRRDGVQAPAVGGLRGPDGPLDDRGQ